MTIVLDHTIVPAGDRAASARFFAELFGLSAGEPVGPFTPVQVNSSLTFDFDDRRPFEVHHYAFHVSDAEFEAIFGRVKARGLVFGSDPYDPANMRVREFNGGRTVYFKDLDGHLLEIRTRTSTEDIAASRRA
ncbi:MAG TPA: VOC family protein [Caulobacteraceae bacterium]|nr:VOC family protein [Caulobacteraceae bacterium]